MHVQTVFSLIENDRMAAVDDIGGHFLAAVRRQTMHKSKILLGPFDEIAVDLESLEILQSLGGFVFPAPCSPTRRNRSRPLR